MRDDVDILEREGSGRRRFVGAGHYREEYRRVGGQWKIQQLVLTRLRVDEVTVRFWRSSSCGGRGLENLRQEWARQ